MKKFDINDLIPLLNPGFIAMDLTGDWYWYEHKPHIHMMFSVWTCEDGEMRCLSGAFNIAKCAQWDKSLIKVCKK